MELIELAVLVAVAVTFAPAIRRFGRGFADDLWVGEPTTPRALLQLLDVAYALVIAGYVLVTTRFEPDVTCDARPAGTAPGGVGAAGR